MSDSSLTPSLERARSLALVAGIAGLVLCGIGAGLDRHQFYRSYLTTYLFWTGIALGCVPVILVHHLAGGAWGVAIRRPLESGALTIPLMALLFLPVAYGIEELYPWANASEVARHPILQAKRVYLNVPAFYGRAALYFVFWSGLALILARLSLAQDRENGGRATRVLGTISGPALVLHFFAVTFASVDWIMSLEPEWYSTIFGPMWLVGQVLASFSLMILVVAPRSGREPRAGGGTGPEALNDLGNLLLAFVMLWAYMHFSQFLIIWSGNLKEEIPWYLARTRDGWQWPAVVLILFEFMLPFLVLLNRESKRRGERLARIAALIVVMHMLAIFWLVVPSFRPRTGLRVHWLDLAAAVGLGGIWLAAFLWLLGRRPPILGDPSSPTPTHHAGGS